MHPFVRSYGMEIRKNFHQRQLPRCGVKKTITTNPVKSELGSEYIRTVPKKAIYRSIFCAHSARVDAMWINALAVLVRVQMYTWCVAVRFLSMFMPMCMCI